MRSLGDLASYGNSKACRCGEISTDHLLSKLGLAETRDAFKEVEELRLVLNAIQAGDPGITQAAANSDLQEARKLAVGRLDEQQRVDLGRRLARYL